jgi:hypothetical protein
MNLEDGGVAVRTDLGLNTGKTPEIGAMMFLQVDGKPIRGEVKAVRQMSMPDTDEIDVLEVDAPPSPFDQKAGSPIPS